MTGRAPTALQARRDTPRIHGARDELAVVGAPQADFCVAGSFNQPNFTTQQPVDINTIDCCEATVAPVLTIGAMAPDFRVTAPTAQKSR